MFMSTERCISIIHPYTILAEKTLGASKIHSYNIVICEVLSTEYIMYIGTEGAKTAERYTIHFPIA